MANRVVEGTTPRRRNTSRLSSDRPLRNRATGRLIREEDTEDNRVAMEARKVVMMDTEDKAASPAVCPAERSGASLALHLALPIL